MDFLNKMERKYKRFALSNLTIYLIITYVAGYVMTNFAPNILDLFLLEPYYILQGQVWRVISWVFLPPTQFNIWTVVMLFFYFSIGRQLERQWGDFRYNIYVFGGIILMIISSFILYFALGMNAPFGDYGVSFCTYYICVSLLLGYAMTAPDEYILLYFIIPIKMRWIALITLIYMTRDLISGDWVTRAEIIATIVNFVLFFGLTQGFKSLLPRTIRRAVNKQLPARKTINPRPVINIVRGNTTKHKCVVCGRTESDGDDLEFRYCSKCEGDYEYCQDHLFTHEHVKKRGDE